MTRAERHGEERRIVFVPPHGPPTRIQLSRRAGFKLDRFSRELNGRPVVVVARPFKWGNPFQVGKPAPEDGQTMTLAMALLRYRLSVEDRIDEIKRELRGKNLACWCKTSECHAAILLRMANS